MSAILAVFVFALLFDVWRSLPDISDPSVFRAEESMVIRDRAGGELYRVVREEDRTLLTREEMSPFIRMAAVAIEDRRFFSRFFCIDVRALTRAVIANLSEYKSQGASTITQQLVRTALLTRSKSIERKLREIMLACTLESQRSKEDILTLYLNWISFGHGIAGVEQASRRFFGIPAHDLSVAQSAVLAALPQRPTYFSPFGAHRRTTVSENLAHRIREGEILDAEAIAAADVTIGLLGTEVRLGSGFHLLPGRANIVLNAMREQEFITDEEHDVATRELSTMNFRELSHPIRAPHFVLSVRDRIETLLSEGGIDGGNIVVETTIDPRLQGIAEEIVAEHRSRLIEEFDARNIALVAADPRTGEILASVGNTDFFDDEHGGQIDMTRTPRQPGSSFKPFVYAAAFLRGLSPGSFIYDSPLSPSIYQPHNYKRGYYGRMTVRNALGRSRNVPAIRAFFMSGEQNVLDLAETMGIPYPKTYKESRVQDDPSFRYAWPLALGSAETPLLEMVQGYATLARGGIYQALTGMRGVFDTNGTPLFLEERRPVRVLDPQVAADLTSILSDKNAREPDWSYNMDIDGASPALKTGTSNVCLERDAYGTCMHVRTNNAWTLGYTDNIVIGVWAGNVENTPLVDDADALLVTMPLWKEFFERGVLRRGN